MITLKSQMTGISGKNKALPREARLRDTAIRRMNEAQLKEIESHLRKLRNTDDLSYSNTKSTSRDAFGATAAAQDETSFEKKIID